MPDTTDLLGEIAILKAMLIASEARSSRKDERIARLEKLVAAFRQAAFGRRSEKGDPDQFELALEDLETAIAVIHAEEDTEDRAAKRPAKPRAANRGSLPKHLPRIEEVIEPDSLTCACGGCLHCIGEDVSDRLDKHAHLQPPTTFKTATKDTAMTHVAIETIEMKTAIVLNDVQSDAMREFGFTPNATAWQKAAFRDFLDTTITQSVTFGDDGNSAITESFAFGDDENSANSNAHSFSPRCYLTFGGQWGALRGGLGDDTYVSDGGDVISETRNAGTDLVMSTASLVLSRNLENLTLTGNIAINGTGNGLKNALVGNAAANILDGGQGADILTGQGGADAFLFSTSLGASNIDTVTDYKVSADSVWLDHQVFAGLSLGTLDASSFVANLTGKATDTFHHIIYDVDDGGLYFDADGRGGVSRIHFADIGVGLAMTNGEFWVI